MIAKKEFDLLINQLFAGAVKEFEETEQYHLLQEKMEQIDRDCDCMFREVEQAFALECFATIQEAKEQEEAYVYHKAFRDCVSVLKWLGVLA